MTLSSPPTIKQCPVCNERGRPPPAPSGTTLDIFRCYTPGCPVVSFFPYAPDLPDTTKEIT